MKEPFQENFRSSKADPLDGPSCDFDWDALDGKVCSCGRDYDDLVCAIRVVFQWVLKDVFTQPRPGDIVARRMMAIAWLLGRDYMPDHFSLSMLAQKLGVSRVALSQHVRRASKRFGLPMSARAHARVSQLQARAERDKRDAETEIRRRGEQKGNVAP